MKSFPLGILLTICIRFKYEDLYCEALDENVEIHTRTQWLRADRATIIYWRFEKTGGFLRKQVGPFSDQVLVGAIGRAFGAWAANVTGKERGVDDLDQGMVQSALQYFDKNLTFDHLENHTDYLYPYRKGGNPKDHFQVCRLRTARVV